LSEEERDNVSDVLIWKDLETTGLDVNRDVILEVAIVVTDNDLNELGHYASVVVDYDPDMFIPDTQARTDPAQILVWENHWETGLIQEIKAVCDDSDQIPTLEVVQAHMIDLLNAHGVTEETHHRKKPPLCGSSVASFDRKFGDKNFPDFMSLLHYRSIDVSTLLELRKRWRPDFVDPDSKGAHRALADIRSSIDYLRSYRSSGFIG